MVEKRRAKRLKDNDEVVVTVFADGKQFPKEKVLSNNSEDISVLGTRIKTNVYFPVNSFIKTEMKLKSQYPMITIIGQVKWIKAILKDRSFEAGVEFIAPPGDIIKNLKDYVAWIESMQDDKSGK